MEISVIVAYVQVHINIVVPVLDIVEVVVHLVMINTLLALVLADMCGEKMHAFLVVQLE